MQDLITGEDNAISDGFLLRQCVRRWRKIKAPFANHRFCVQERRVDPNRVNCSEEIDCHWNIASDKAVPLASARRWPTRSLGSAGPWTTTSPNDTSLSTVFCNNSNSHGVNLLTELLHQQLLFDRISQWRVQGRSESPEFPLAIPLLVVPGLVGRVLLVWLHPSCTVVFISLRPWAQALRPTPTITDMSTSSSSFVCFGTWFLQCVSSRVSSTAHCLDLSSLPWYQYGWN